MDLRSPHSFWLLRNGIGDVPPPLDRDVGCDVAIVGAGITGALVADAMSARGLSVVVLDRRQPGQGSTAASTALLQYEIDTHLVDLAAKLGREHAIEAYRASLHGLRALGRTARGLDAPTAFRPRPSLYLASTASDAKRLRVEARARRAAKLPCDVLGPREIAKRVDVSAQLALWSSAGGEVDPWLLASALLERGRARGVALYGRTEVLELASKRRWIDVVTARGLVRARHVVVATGYEAARFLPRPVAKLRSTFALVTEPVASFDGWRKRCLIWESARPYFYLRTTTDGRIVVGGEDVPFRDASRRDQLVPRKAKKLLARARELFPRIEMEIAFAWAGTFGETKDGLGYIGAHPELDPRVHFALGYGGNGITYSAIAAEVLTASVLGRAHRYSRTFAFDR